MEGNERPELGRILDSAEAPSSGESSSSARCGLCEESIRSGGDRVEVSLSSDEPDGADAWLCPSCYEHVVGSMGIPPVRVFKSGTQRRVVLPVSPPGRSSGSD